MSTLESNSPGGLIAPDGPSLSDKMISAAGEVVQKVSKSTLGEGASPTREGGGEAARSMDGDEPLADSSEEAREEGRKQERKEERRATVTNLVVRLTALVIVLGGIYFAAKFFGVIDYIHSGELQRYMVDAGWTGVAVFCLVYCVGVVAHIPGLVFVFAAVLAYGPVGGGTVSLLGGIPAVAITFLVVRAVGGTALAHVKNPYMRRVLSHLDERPIRSILLLRLVFIMAPGVNYGLAITKVKFRDYLIGSAIGLIIPIAVSSFIIDYIWN